MFSALTAKAPTSIRGLLRIPQKENPATLKHALKTLGIRNDEELEERLLSLDAFLEPWSVFRDNILFHHPDAMPQLTSLSRVEGERKISRNDILRFYTQFDESVMRYDPRADEDGPMYIDDTSIHGVIDKSSWRLDEHEKHLYAWLLQSFKVGKKKNPWGFKYFELKNICIAWEEVLVPIVNAVRASYDRRGRQHYGNHALYIEARSPSGLAFPTSNVKLSEDAILSPTPYRMVSVPKKPIYKNGGTMQQLTETRAPVFSKKHYDELEQELRETYPLYGGLVERPKFKINMEEWFAEQRARVERRKLQEKGEEQKSNQETGQVKPSKRDRASKFVKSVLMPFVPSQKDDLQSKMPVVINRPEDQLQRYSDNINRSVSIAGPSKLSERKKNPLHGVTRQLDLPESSTSSPYLPFDWSPPTQSETSSKHDQEESDHSSKLQQWQNEQHAFWRSSKILSKRSLKGKERADQFQEPDWPLDDLPPHHVQPALDQAMPQTEKKAPSYEGNDYKEEISLTDLHAFRKSAARTPQPPVPTKLPSRIPAPIAPVPYSGHTRVASRDSNRNEPRRSQSWKRQTWADPGRSMEDPFVESSGQAKKSWKDGSPPRAVPWPGSDSPDSVSENKNPGPVRLEDRQHSIMQRLAHPPMARRLFSEETDMRRIISKENIRAAIGSGSKDSSVEDLPIPKPFAEPARASPGKTLHTYNVNHFPRKE